jgi:hypothetical protein
MGDAAEDLYFRELNKHMDLGRRERVREAVAEENKKLYDLGQLKWPMKSGEKILVKDMDNHHIDSSLRMLKRQVRAATSFSKGFLKLKKSWIWVFESEIEARIDEEDRGNARRDT